VGFIVHSVCGFDSCEEYGSTFGGGIPMTDWYAQSSAEGIIEANTANLDTCGCKECAPQSLSSGGKCVAGPNIDFDCVNEFDCPNDAATGYEECGGEKDSPGWILYDASYPGGLYIPCGDCCDPDNPSDTTGCDFDIHNESYCIIPGKTPGYPCDCTSTTLPETYWIDDDCDGVATLQHGGNADFCATDPEVNIYDELGHQASGLHEWISGDGEITITCNK